MVKSIVFDLNGVLIDTTELNASIFEMLFEAFGEGIGAKAAEHYRYNGGIPRRKRMKMYIEMFTEADADDETVDMLTEMFSGFFRMNIDSIELLPGVEEFFEQNKGKYTFFISSGATTGDTKAILEKKGLLQYFREIFGSPDSKTEHLKTIMHKYSLSGDEIVFVGDAPADAQAATEAGVKFVARRTKEHHWHDYPYVIDSLQELPEILAKLNAVTD